LTTKVILTAADESTAVAVDIAPGQTSDFSLAEGVIRRTRQRGPVDQLVGDKGFDSDALRGHLIDRNVCPVIPNKANRVDPWPFDERAYRERNKVERLFATARPFRRVATRYDKLRATFLGLLHLTLGFIRLRSSVNTA
jgi:transposase